MFPSGHPFCYDLITVLLEQEPLPQNNLQGLEDEQTFQRAIKALCSCLHCFVGQAVEDGRSTVAA